MSMLYPHLPPTRSLRIRLLVASVLIEAVMLTLLIANGVRLVDEHLVRNTQVRVEFQEASYNITLASLLASRDYSGLQSVIEGWRAADNVSYMVVSDTAGRVVARTGWSADTPPPLEDTELSPDSPQYRGEFDVTYLNQRYGHVHYAMDTAFLALARDQMLRQSLVIAAIEIALTAALLASVGYLLTRHLGALTQVSLKVARGDFSQHIDIKRSDEVGVLSQAFNTMADAVRARIDELEESHERFRAIANYTHGWENWFGTDGRLRWINPAVERITGYSPQTCYVMPDFPMPLVVPEDCDKVARHLAAAQAGKSGEDEEFRVTRHDGEEIWVAMSWQPIFDRAGVSLGFRASMRDVTAQTRSIALMLDAKNELERLLHAASHDLQEPVRLVQTYTQVLERELREDLPEGARDSLSIIRQGTGQLRHLVKGLTDFSHSAHARSGFTAVDCRAVVDKAISDCGPAAAAADFQIDPLPQVFGDAPTLHILFENLISNAIKFRRKDVPAQIRITGTAEDGGWRIDVADNGIGIDPADLATITRPFSRVYPRSDFPGAGLGLASASKAAAVHGGRLWLDSVPGQGTIAHVWLPALAE